MLTQQQADLIHDEGDRPVVYDDKTGLPIRPGSKVQGHPTIGIGRALDVNGISATEAAYLLRNDIAAIEHALASLPWYYALDPVRQGVMVNLAFNMGVRNLESFTLMIAAIEAGEHALSASFAAAAQADFGRAADELQRSSWARQVQPARVARLVGQLRDGIA